MIKLKQNEAFLVTSFPNLFYLTGYKNEDAAALVYGGTVYYATDSRCATEAAEAGKGRYEVVPIVKGETYIGKAVAVLKGKIDGKSKLFYEEERVKKCEYTEISAALKAVFGADKPKLAKGEKLFTEAKSVKTEAEINNIKSAQRITDRVFWEITTGRNGKGILKDGITEKDVKNFIDCEFIKAGAENAFDTIVAFGERAALPHAHPSDRKLKKGDCILIDFGAKYNGYCSDMTRTFVYGYATEEFKAAYKLVLEAQELALKTAKAGEKRGCDIMNQVVDFFKENGADQHFTHSLGHSLGVEIHEKPGFRTNDSSKLAVNNIITFEPGLYFEGKFGIRIEDMAIITEKGTVNLTHSPKELLII
ncbi:MAG: Xaa-Pro peptidase family protein [Christensenellaceae bacterium]|jgi:Xaa-Pro aminopeptidase|nr:Xaa-Pro peptidase family protein [Christensenellaceae bacterium]